MVKKCVHCGGEFEIADDNSRSKKREYCSDRCKNRARDMRKKGVPVVIEKVCVECGKTYIAKRHDSVTCGRDCNCERNKKRAKAAGEAYRARMKAEKAMKREVVKSKKACESITDIQRKASAMGMSYGKYMAYMSMQRGAF